MSSRTPTYLLRVRPDVLRNGSAYIMSLVILSLTATLATSFAYQTDLNLVQSDNYAWILRARLASESGLDFSLYQLKSIRLVQQADANTLAAALGQALTNKIGGSPMLGGHAITVNGNIVSLPPIAAADGTFTTSFTATSATRVTLSVTGKAGQVYRRAQITLNITPRRSGAFDYGLASKGPVSFFGNARLLGVNTAGEASIFSASAAAASAISVSGNCQLSGDLSVVGSTTSISITGTPTIGNTSDPDEWADHIHFGVDAPDFPQYDTNALAPLATTVIDSHTDFSKVTTLSNIRIKAGTNPVFSNKVVLNGIIYIEAPNNVSFTGQATVNGLIVTQQAQPSQLSQCQISFTGGVDANGVEALPTDDPQYTAVRQKTGTFVLAPGFGVTFAGHVDAVNGTIAADQLTFTGSAVGTVKGSIIGLGTGLTSMGGTVDFYIDRNSAASNPAGFVQTYAMIADPDSYVELTGP